jgi:hypothetical protein
VTNTNRAHKTDPKRCSQTASFFCCWIDSTEKRTISRKAAKSAKKSPYFRQKTWRLCALARETTFFQRGLDLIKKWAGSIVAAPSKFRPLPKAIDPKW